MHQAGGRGPGRANSPIRAGQRVHVLERGTTLDPLRRSRRKEPRADGEQQQQAGGRQLQHEMTRRGSPEIRDDPAHGPRLLAVALMILVEDQPLAPTTTRRVIARVLEHPNSRDVRAPSANPQDVVPEKIRVSRHHHTAALERESDHRR